MSQHVGSADYRDAELADASDVMCRDYCDHCGWKGDQCSCWMLDPVYTDEPI